MLDKQRRRFLAATSSAIVASAAGSSLATRTAQAQTTPSKKIRWGFVGTGSISNKMANAIKQADNAEIVTVSSRRMDSAEDFSHNHNLNRAFDSWEEMAAWEGVDAIYLATPTSVKEEIATFAAKNKKHVLAEKPFVNLPSLQRIANACQDNGVGFMDGTHFVHTPRTSAVQAHFKESAQWPWSIDSAFQFNLKDKNNIRFNTALEPMGAIGDAGWYCMRATAEFLSPKAELQSANSFLRRDEETGAAISGSGVLLFNDGSTATWNCGFDSGSTIMDVRITGLDSVVKMNDFVASGANNSSYEFIQGGRLNGQEITVSANRSGATLMFEHFTKMASDSLLIKQSIQTSSKTQMLLDAAWQSGVENEKS